MSDWIGVIFLILLVAGAWCGLRALGKPRRLSEREFEQNISVGKSLVNAGIMELDKFINPQAAKSIEVVRELKNGKYNKKRLIGDAEENTDSAANQRLQ